MKRPLPLVDYPHSDDSDEERKSKQSAPQPKKRKLPSLSSSVILPKPIDDPAQHQGRIRTHPHVYGQYATHVYISLRLKNNSTIYQLFQSVLRDAKNMVPSLHECCKTGDTSSDLRQLELHISLSRPIYLLVHQREEFKKDIRNVAKHHQPFSMSFTNFAELTNDEETRAFLVIDVGAGYHELKAIMHSLSPILKLLHQKDYYECPRFHASIAWALLTRKLSDIYTPPITVGETHDVQLLGTTTLDEYACSRPSTPTTDIGNEFPTIPHFPEDFITTLNERYSSTLSSAKVGLFDVQDLTVKIGKDVFVWRLGI
ncbi:hypothetical protein AMATHDRAFT_76990 [Amanita thiersii Skay4041]|uniref:U6 snRNA phosphodiesterase 1 n=1 Tax=Amanita thiersii Skay4041 TaxID=703135 RepID=A0A2A9NI12_9AGAR|nr:hypothetical protein AMATHDRAFT_76990 [Amanita thiersii Skay4041]